MSEKWIDNAMHHFEQDLTSPTTHEIKQSVMNHGNAALGIWLGIFLDGIPESLVIGSSLLTSHGGEVAVMSLSLIGGLFLSNFPEALSSSVGMRENGYSFSKILVMWTSLMIFTGIGSFLGSLFFEGASEEMFVLIKSMAAGAMLTMIAETMLPEAFHKGGYITGLSTLMGFLAAIFMKVLE
jgi:zinc transporter ZupT